MIFTCSNCNAQYKISDDRVPSKGAKVKCKKCGNIITIKPPESGTAESDSFQNEATVVQRSPFAQEEERGKDSTRVVTADQAAGIFKSLIDEHSRDAETDNYTAENGQSDYNYQEASNESYHGEQISESPDDRLTSVYENQQEERVEDEVDRQVNQMLNESPDEEDISREATRVVSTDQLKEMVGEDAVSDQKENLANKQSYAHLQQQPYVAPKSRGEWYVAIGQMQVGPLSLNEVEEKWGRGEINSTTLVWKAGMAGWQPLMYVPELSHLVPPAQEPREVEQPPIKEFMPAQKSEESRMEGPSSSAFPSLDDLSRQEEELKSQKEEEPQLDWKPAAGDALASLVQDEMESINRGFSTDIPISNSISKPEERSAVQASTSIDSGALPFEKPVENVPVAVASTQNISTPPVTISPPVDQPVVISPPYQQASYPPVYPPVYSQPPFKAQKKNWLIPVLIGIVGLIIIVGSVLGYVLYSKLAGEKIQPIPQQPQQQVTKTEQPTQQQQPPQQLQQQQQQIAREQPKQEEQAIKQEEKKEEVQKKAESETHSKEEKPQKIKVAKKEEKLEKQEKQSTKKQIKEVDEMPPPPKKEEKIARAEVPEPPKKKQQKGSDSLLDFEGDQSPKGSQGGLPKTLAQEQILEVVKANIGRIKACMVEQAKRDSSVKGKLIIGWEIQPNGKTKGVQIKTPQFKGTYIGTCISSVVSDFTFPKFSGPPIPIEFPFNIK